MATTLATNDTPERSDYSARNNSQAYAEVPIGHVAPLGLNHRTHFDVDRLAELAEDIRQRGILQPLIVRPIEGRGMVEYEIIAGERRWRAAIDAGLTTVPVIVRNETDEDARAIAIVENIQRVDIDPIEEAHGYKALSDLGIKQAKIAAMVNRSQPAVANAMRLLDLPADVQERIQKRELSASHGIALAKWTEFPAVCSGLAEIAVKKHLSSHDLEKGALGRYAYDLKEAVQIIGGYGTRFDVSACKGCPFQAYRHENYTQICLKPDHYRELQASALKAEQLRQREAVADRLKDADHSVSPEQITEAVQHLQHIKDVKSYYRIDGTKPLGCASECPCRQSVIGHDGEIVSICNDPVRYNDLEKSDREREQEARRGPVMNLFNQAKELLDTSGIYSREAAMLAVALINDCNRESVTAEFGAAGIEFPADLGYGGYDTDLTETFEFLSQYSPGQTLKAAIRTLFVDEARRAIAWPGNTQDITRWYLGLTETEGESEDVDGATEEQPIPEAEAAGSGTEEDPFAIENEVAEAEEDDPTDEDEEGSHDPSEVESLDAPSFIGVNTEGDLPTIPVDPARLQIGGDIASAFSYETITEIYGKREIERPVKVEGEPVRFYAVTYLSDTEAVGWQVVHHEAYKGKKYGLGNVLDIVPKEGKFEGLIVRMPGVDGHYVLTRPVRFVADSSPEGSVAE